MISKFNISFSLLSLLIILSSCKEKSSTAEMSTSYKRTGTIGSVSEKKRDKAIGHWKMKQIVISTGTENKIININKDVIISENDIQDNQKKVIAKSVRDHTGFYNFTNLDSLNGFLYVKDTYPDGFMTFNSGLAVKIKNNIPDKKTSVIKIIFEK